VPVRAWAESAALAKSAVAYNSSTLNRAREAGVKFMHRALSRRGQCPLIEFGPGRAGRQEPVRLGLFGRALTAIFARSRGGP
jgi:hypothetical protein